MFSVVMDLNTFHLPFEDKKLESDWFKINFDFKFFELAIMNSKMKAPTEIMLI